MGSSTDVGPHLWGGTLRLPPLSWVPWVTVRSGTSSAALYLVEPEKSKGLGLGAGFLTNSSGSIRCGGTGLMLARYQVSSHEELALYLARSQNPYS